MDWLKLCFYSVHVAQKSVPRIDPVHGYPSCAEEHEFANDIKWQCAVLSKANKKVFIMNPWNCFIPENWKMHIGNVKVHCKILGSKAEITTFVTVLHLFLGDIVYGPVLQLKRKMVRSFTWDWFLVKISSLRSPQIFLERRSLATLWFIKTLKIRKFSCYGKVSNTRHKELESVIQSAVGIHLYHTDIYCKHFPCKYAVQMSLIKLTFFPLCRLT